jgi:IS5 family transposase
MIRMLLIGYCLGIRSERRLCEEVHLNLAYRWFCRLGLEGKVPDHSTFSKNRHGRFRESNLFRRLFEAVVQRCLDEGLVGGEGFAVDASLIQADANKQRSLPGAEWIAQDHPSDAPRAVREYLATLDEAAWGAATEVEPKFVSPSDPAAQWTGALRGPAFFAYADNYLIDLKAAVIVDVEASRAVRQAEVGAARTMLERTADRFGFKPERLAADSAYGSAEMLHWLVDGQKIEPHVPVIDKSERQDGTFSRSDFTYDPETDTYTCPEGKTLTTSGRIVNEGTTRIYLGSTFDCGPCPLKEQCCPNTPARKIPRSIYEHAREVARALAGTPAYERSRQGSQAHRDAVCPSQADPEDGPSAATGSVWGSGRVPIGSHRPEPEKACQTGHFTRASDDPKGLRRSERHTSPQIHLQQGELRRCPSPSERRLCHAIGQEPTFAASSPRIWAPPLPRYCIEAALLHSRRCIYAGSPAKRSPSRRSASSSARRR